MILEWFSRWKVSTSPSPGWRKVDFRAHKRVYVGVQTSSDEQTLLKNKNWATCGFRGTYLFSIRRNEGCTGVKISCCVEVGQRTKILALRVIPGAESGLWQSWRSETCSPVHLPMDATVTPTPNHDKLLLKLDRAGCTSSILKVKHVSTCGGFNAFHVLEIFQYMCVMCMTYLERSHQLSGCCRQTRRQLQCSHLASRQLHGNSSLCWKGNWNER